jgi:MFS family permease
MLLHRTIQKYKNLLTHAIPSLIAIIISGIVDVEIFLHNPFDAAVKEWFVDHQTQETMKRIGWSFLQIFPAFIFGFISDHYHRRKMLILSQLLGVLGGVFLWIFKFETWVIFFIGLTFNPLSVARAAMLDNYPKISALKVIAVTYIAKNIAWVLMSLYSDISFERALYYLLPVLLGNAILMYFVQKDKFDNKAAIEELSNASLIKQNKIPIFLTLAALSIAETTFYILWIYLESGTAQPVLNVHEKWLSITALGTLLGTSFSMFYRKIPHFSIITILYSAGAGIMFVAILCTKQLQLSYDDNLMSAMSHYCVIGGIYLPFVTDAFIELSGAKRKATGSAFSEMGDAIALFLASIFAIFVGIDAFSMLINIMGLYIFATILQRCAERNEDKKLA